jgi:hypothetical protein
MCTPPFHSLQLFSTPAIQLPSTPFILFNSNSLQLSSTLLISTPFSSLQLSSTLLISTLFTNSLYSLSSLGSASLFLRARVLTPNIFPPPMCMHGRVLTPNIFPPPMHVPNHSYNLRGGETFVDDGAFAYDLADGPMVYNPADVCRLVPNANNTGCDFFGTPGGICRLVRHICWPHSRSLFTVSCSRALFAWNMGTTRALIALLCPTLFCSSCARALIALLCHTLFCSSCARALIALLCPTLFCLSCARALIALLCRTLFCSSCTRALIALLCHTLCQSCTRALIARTTLIVDFLLQSVLLCSALFTCFECPSGRWRLFDITRLHWWYRLGRAASWQPNDAVRGS